MVTSIMRRHGRVPAHQGPVRAFGIFVVWMHVSILVLVPCLSGGALLGLTGASCVDRNGQESRPRAKEWDQDFGEPVGGAACYETGDDSGIFERKWTKATVQWDCSVGHGRIIEL